MAVWNGMIEIVTGASSGIGEGLAKNARRRRCESGPGRTA